MVPILQLVEFSHHPYTLDVVQSKECIYEIYVESCAEDMNLACMFWNLEQQPIKLKTLPIFHFQLPQICMCIGLICIGLIWSIGFFSSPFLFLQSLIWCLELCHIKNNDLSYLKASSILLLLVDFCLFFLKHFLLCHCLLLVCPKETNVTCWLKVLVCFCSWFLLLATLAIKMGNM